MQTFRSWLVTLVLCSLSSAVALAEDLEFVGDGEIKALEEVEEAPAEEEAAPAPSAGARDTEPPRIEDIAVAAANPNMAPMVTAVITDDYSGVDRALFFYRLTGENEFKKAVLVPGAGGLFIARLPDGVQLKGFDYYVEVYDAANAAPSRIGSADVPLFVPAASGGTTLSSTYVEDEFEGAHPGWVMLSIGSGMVLSAASGWFFYDLGTVVLPALKEAEGKQLDDQSEAALRNSLVGDVLMGSALATLGVAALGTGVVLMALSSDVE